MARPITLLAVFFLSLSLFSGFLMTTGVAEMVGIETSVGGGDEIDEAVNQSEDIRSGSPTGSTLFGMYNVLADGLSTLALPITAGPTMLERAGLPSQFTNMILQPIIAIVYALGIISFLRGWSL